MDEEDKKPGTTQVPLINDLIFDESLPLRSPRKKAPAEKKPTTHDRIPPGYDPDTGDLFGELDEPGPPPGDDDPPPPGPDTGEETSRLRQEIAGELESLLKSLDSPPNQSR